jgi:hypothetical protein
MTQPVYADLYKVYADLASVWTDITQYVIRDIDAEWGMNGNGPLDLLAETGTMDLTLDNQGANLIPDMPGALANWKKGVGIKLVITFEGQDYVRFKGVVESIKPGNGLYGHLRVMVHVVDWLEYAAKHPIVNPGVLTNQRGDDVIRTVLGLMPIQPAALDLEAGISVFGTTFDTVTSHTKAYAEFGKIVFSETGYIYLKKDRLNGETLVFESAHHRSGLNPISVIEKSKANSGFLLKEDGGFLLKEDGFKIILNQTEEFLADNTMMAVEAEYGERVINYFTVYANPRRVDASPQVLFQLDEPVFIGSGQTIQFKGSYADPAGGLPINGQNMITPVITTDYLMNTASDGSGTDISSDLVVTPNYGTEGFNHTLKNNSTSTGWITKFNARGYGIYNYNPLEHAESDGDSIAELGTLPESMDQKYQTSLVQGSIYAATTVEEERTPRMILNKAIFNANSSNQRMMAFLNGDVGFLFRCMNDVKGIDDLYYVQGVQFKIKPGGFIMFTWNVKNICSLLLGFSQIAVEFAGGSATDGVNYGYVPHLSNLRQRTISAWIYMDTDVPDTTYYGLVSYGVNYLFSVKQNRKLQIYQVHTGGGAVFGIWQTPTNSLPLSAWTHVLVTHDTSSDVSADPIVYINGTSQTLNESSTPAGTIGDETGLEFVLGNVHSQNNDFSEAFDGKIKDVRIYNRVLSAGEVTTLYNGGTPSATLVTDGMVFQAFCVRTKDLAAFVDDTLTASMKLLDNVHRVVGTPHGAPVGRNP